MIPRTGSPLTLIVRTYLREPNGKFEIQQVGVVDQEPVLFAGSIADNIRYGAPSATSAEVEEAARQVGTLQYGHFRVCRQFHILCCLIISHGVTGTCTPTKEMVDASR